MKRLQELKLVFRRTELEPQMSGWTDRRGSRNSYLDEPQTDFATVNIKKSKVDKIFEAGKPENSIFTILTL